MNQPLVAAIMQTLQGGGLRRDGSWPIGRGLLSVSRPSPASQNTDALEYAHFIESMRKHLYTGWEPFQRDTVCRIGFSMVS